MDLSSNAITFPFDFSWKSSCNWKKITPLKISNVSARDLSSNIIASLPEGLFADLTNLYRLWVLLNIISLPTKSFLYFGTRRWIITSYFITYVKVQVQAWIFSRLIFTTALWGNTTTICNSFFLGWEICFFHRDLQKNAIASLPERLFANSSNLRSLWVTRNKSKLSMNVYSS